jgi:hypothetical protein
VREGRERMGVVSHSFWLSCIGARCCDDCNKRIVYCLEEAISFDLLRALDNA